MTSFPVPGLDPAWIREREAALMAIALSAVRFLEADARKQIADAAVEVAEQMTDSGAKDGLIAFGKAINP